MDQSCLQRACSSREWMLGSLVGKLLALNRTLSPRPETPIAPVAPMYPPQYYQGMQYQGYPGYYPPPPPPPQKEGLPPFVWVGIGVAVAVGAGKLLDTAKSKQGDIQQAMMQQMLKSMMVGSKQKPRGPHAICLLLPLALHGWLGPLCSLIARWSGRLINLGDLRCCCALSSPASHLDVDSCVVSHLGCHPPAHPACADRVKLSFPLAEGRGATARWSQPLRGCRCQPVRGCGGQPVRWGGR